MKRIATALTLAAGLVTGSAGASQAAPLGRPEPTPVAAAPTVVLPAAQPAPEAPPAQPVESTPLALRPAAAPQPLALAQEQSTTWLFVKLGAFALLVGLLVYYFQRRTSGSGNEFRVPRSITIHTRARIGIRSEVVWLEAGGQHLLVGVGPTGMRTLAELPMTVDEEVADVSSWGADLLDEQDTNVDNAPRASRANAYQRERDSMQPTEAAEREAQPRTPERSVDRRFSELLARTRNEPQPQPPPLDRRRHASGDGTMIEGQASGLMRARRG